MTNYNAWDKKASALEKEVDDDDEEEKKKNDAACGLEDGPQGPPSAKAKEQRAEMNEHSTKRKNFIDEQQSREVALENVDKTEPIVIGKDQADNRALRLRKSKNVTYELPEGLTLLKLFVENCENVKVIVRCQIMTQFLEMGHCSDVDISVEKSVATVQVDECCKGPVRFNFLEPEFIGSFFHQNSPSVEITVSGSEVAKIGNATASQWCSKYESGGNFLTQPVVRGEKDFPLNLGGGYNADKHAEPEAEAAPASEERKMKAEEKRQEGNEAFRASDFLQAAAHYTEAIGLDDTLYLAWANRAQCFLKTGSPDRALEDATKCTVLEPSYAKGWFRKGMALHAMKRYGAAIPAFCEAEKLDPKNEQIPEAIKFAQLMCRKDGPGDP